MTAVLRIHLLQVSIQLDEPPYGRLQVVVACGDIDPDFVTCASDPPEIDWTSSFTSSVANRTAVLPSANHSRSAAPVLTCLGSSVSKKGEVELPCRASICSHAIGTCTVLASRRSMAGHTFGKIVAQPLELLT